MGQAQRRKHLGLYPVQIKPKKPTRVKFDPMDDMSEISILALVMSGLLSHRRKYTPYLREDDFA